MPRMKRGRSCPGRLARRLGWLWLAGAALVAVLWRAETPAQTPLPAGDAQRGAYLFAAAGCEACHTDVKNQGKPLAGGRALATPFGTFFAPNITPDRETGLGAWSAADFRNAMRDGRGAGGVHLFPVFPYPSFTGMTDQDIADLWAHLSGLEAVRQPNKPQEVSFPFGWRFLMTFWNLLFLEKGPLPPVAGQGAEWNRGRYLVEAVAHCQECHTPRNWFGALARSRAMAGVKGGPDGMNAPNVTPDPTGGIGKWSLDDITTLLQSGQTPDFDFVGSGMGEEVKNSTSKLTDADRRAIAVYLKSLPPQASPPRVKD
jgi:mono/diheme cytochrome c family protein